MPRKMFSPKPFGSEELGVDIEDDKAAGLTAEVKKIVKKFEPDVEVIEK